MRPLDIAGIANVLAEFGQQLEIALHENKQLEEENKQLKEEIEKLKDAKQTDENKPTE